MKEHIALFLILALSIASLCACAPTTEGTETTRASETTPEQIDTEGGATSSVKAEDTTPGSTTKGDSSDPALNTTDDSTETTEWIEIPDDPTADSETQSTEPADPSQLPNGGLYVGMPYSEMMALYQNSNLLHIIGATYYVKMGNDDIVAVFFENNCISEISSIPFSRENPSPQVFNLIHPGMTAYEVLSILGWPQQSKHGASGMDTLIYESILGTTHKIYLMGCVIDVHSYPSFVYDPYSFRTNNATDYFSGREINDGGLEVMIAEKERGTLYTETYGDVVVVYEFAEEMNTTYVDYQLMEHTNVWHLVIYVDGYRIDASISEERLQTIIAEGESFEGYDALFLPDQHRTAIQRLIDSVR